MRNEEMGNCVYDREVDLYVTLSGGAEGVRFCTARSTIIVRSPEIDAAIKDGSVGVGQLFRHYNILPKFR